MPPSIVWYCLDPFQLPLRAEDPLPPDNDLPQPTAAAAAPGVRRWTLLPPRVRLSRTHAGATRRTSTGPSRLQETEEEEEGRKGQSSYA